MLGVKPITVFLGFGVNIVADIKWRKHICCGFSPQCKLNKYWWQGLYGFHSCQNERDGKGFLMNWCIQFLTIGMGRWTSRQTALRTDMLFDWDIMRCFWWAEDLMSNEIVVNARMRGSMTTLIISMMVTAARIVAREATGGWIAKSCDDCQHDERSKSHNCSVMANPHDERTKNEVHKVWRIDNNFIGHIRKEFQFEWWFS